MVAKLSFVLLVISGSEVLQVLSKENQASRSINSIQDGLSQLEEMFIQDCHDNLSPHGYYGAFFQPCEFSFFQSSKDATSGSCQENNFIGTRKPVHWLFELQKHIDKDDWDELSSDDIPDWDDLMMWPDQCVAVEPRCYPIRETTLPSKNETDLMEVLLSLFPDGIPNEATHVQVDCRVDAMELSRVAYSVANGVEKGLGFAIALFLAVILLFIVAMSFCCYGCFHLCFSRRRSQENMVPIYHAVPASSEFASDGMAKALVQQKDFELATKKGYQAIAV
jgi:hypothetical protein